MVEDGELNCCKATYDGVVLLPWSFAMLACAGRVVRTLSTCKPYLWSLSIIEKALRNSFRVWSESCVSREDTITLKSRNRSLSAFITVGLGLPCAFVAATFADDRRRSAASCAAPPPDRRQLPAAPTSFRTLVRVVLEPSSPQSFHWNVLCERPPPWCAVLWSAAIRAAAIAVDGIPTAYVDGELQSHCKL